jgi:hypothetical protein
LNLEPKERNVDDNAKKSTLDLKPYRFGRMAIFRGYVTLNHVQQALTEQVEDNVNGRSHRLLGKILREKGWITEEQEESILKEMSGE